MKNCDMLFLHSWAFGLPIKCLISCSIDLGRVKGNEFEMCLSTLPSPVGIQIVGPRIAPMEPIKLYGVYFHHEYYRLERLMRHDLGVHESHQKVICV